EITYSETRPSAGLALMEGTFSGSNSVEDSLSLDKSKLRLSFSKLIVFVNVLDYLRKKEITIKEISIVRPEVYIRTGDDHPFDLLRPESNGSIGKADTLLRNLHFDIQKLSLQDGCFTLEDIKHQFVTKWNGIQVTLKGKFSGQESRASLLFKSDSSGFISPGYSLNNDFPITFKSDLLANWDKRMIDIESADVHVNNIPFTVCGTSMFESPQKTWIDASFTLSATKLDELLNYIPSRFILDRHKYEIAGQTSLAGTLKGAVGKDLYPDIKITGKLTDGSFFRKGMKSGIDAIGMDFSFVYPSANPDSLMVEIKNLNVSGLNCFLRGKAKVTNLLRNPFVDLELKSDINFDRLGSELFNPDTILLSGDMKSDLSLVFNLDDLRKNRYERIWAEGALDINRLKMNSDIYGLNAFVLNAHASIGYKQNQSHFIKQREVLGATIHMDTLYFKWGQQMQVAISDLNASSNTGLQQDTAAVTPLTTHLRIHELQARIFDDVAMLSSNMELHAGIRPSDKDKRQVVMAMAFTSDAMEYLDIVNQQATILSKSQFVSEFYPKSTIKWNLGFNPQKLFEEWDTKGYLIFDHLRTFSRQFPVQINMRGTKLGFKNNRLILNNAEIQVGKSDALVSGEIVTTKQDGKKQRFIEGNLSVQSNHIDFNELKQALLQGDKLDGKQSKSSTASLLNIENLDQSIQEIEANKKTVNELMNQIIYIPENLNISISLILNDLDIYDFNMQEMKGLVTLREKKVSCDFSTRTNMGDTRMDLVYKTETPKAADIYLDWDLNRIQVGKLRKMFPAIETLFPMLNSIDGILNCKLVAYCPIDSVMNVELGSLYAACALDGKDMVLFSNDTFHQIADKLRFNDKKHNQINRLAVEFIAKDQVIDIFPFTLDMDRYSFVIGGKHSMDMSFNYHVDVVKSPIPFNFGLNIDGVLGNFNYKLVPGSRYKNLYKKPIQYEEFRMSKQRKMDEVRAEMRGEMRK
ncbi:hypothetical protein, partial [Parabacteroides sp.]